MGKKLNGQQINWTDIAQVNNYAEELEKEVKRYRRLLRKREEKNRKFQNRYYFLLRKISKGNIYSTAEKFLRHGISKLT